MKARAFALFVFVSGLLVASYLCWAWHRTTGSVFISDSALWPRPWPYPDGWLYRWEQHLDAARPALPGTIKLAGEWQLLHIYLSGWIVLSLLASCGSCIWFILKKRRGYV